MKYILVTGAYGGMGKATVDLLRQNGFFVFALDKKVGKAEENVIPIEADITSADDVASVVNKIKEFTSELYAILHYAGVYMLDSLVEMDHESFEHIFKVNVFGAFLLNKASLPLLKKGGKIIMITSELAVLDPLPFTGIYAVTKSTLDKYAYSLRMELQLLGISVSVLRAGAVDTDMLGASTDALCKFCEKTKLYSCNANRFKRIVDSVEARSVAPNKIASKTLRILRKKSSRFSYSINRNPLLLLLNALPKSIQLWVIRSILK